MKIQRLDLKAFGPFTDHVLDFDSAQTNFHIVFGQNEAGKSSSMRALSAWLYGIETKTEDNFKHAYKDMRVGGVLQNASTSLEAIRRKGNKNTLRATDDKTVIDDARLTQFLQGIDENTFRTRFAIDYPEMHRGGQMVKDHSSEIGELLFSAATGLGSFEEIKNKIQTEADELFKDQGRSQKITVAIKEWNDLRKKIKSAQLAPDFEKTHFANIENATESADQIKEKIGQINQQLARLERISNAIPKIQARQQLQQDLETFANVPTLRDSFATERNELLYKRDTLEAANKKAEGLIKSAQERIDKLEYSEIYIQCEPQIKQLQGQLGEYLKADRDQDDVGGRRKEKTYQIEKLVHQMGSINLEEDVEEHRLSTTDIQRIRKLSDEYTELHAAQRQAKESLGELQREQASVQNKLASLDDNRSVEQLEACVKSARTQGNIDKAIAELNAKRASLEVSLQSALASLPNWNGTVEQLAAVAIPLGSTIDSFEKKMSESNSKADLERQLLKKLCDDLQETTTELKALEDNQDVPTEADLNSARQTRDQKLSEIAEMLDGDHQKDTLADELDKLTALVHQGDELADRLRREANRVAEKTALAAKVNHLETKRDQQSNVLSELEKQAQDLHAQWEDAWEGTCVAPLSPAEMKSWTAARESILKQKEESDGIDRELAQAKDLKQQHITSLYAALFGLNESPADNQSLLSDALEFAESVVSRILVAQSNREKLADKLEGLESQVEATQHKIKLREDDLKQWQQNWQTAIERLTSDPSTMPDQADTLLDQNKELFELIKQRDVFDKRISDMQALVDDYRESVRRLCVTLEIEFNQDEVRDIVEQCQKRVIESRENRTTLNELEKTLVQEQANLDESSDQLKAANKKLAALCKEAGCDSHEQLPEIEDQAKQKNKITQDLRQVNLNLTELTSTNSLEEFIAEARQHDPDTLPGEIEELKRQHEELDSQYSQVNQQIGELKNELKQLDGSDQLAQWNADAEFLAAQVVTESQRYMQLRLAQKSLERIMERYREKNQNPVLELASDYFARLTLQSFAGLQVDYADAQPILVGVRPDRKTVHVDGMSEGTRDQLYLSIRLAGLSLFLETKEPIPLIIDDLLIKFDDQRAVAALELLLEISSKTQVIFFTHHQHVLDLATKHLGKNKVNITNL